MTTCQTAIIIRHNGEQVLVRLNDVHVPRDAIKVDTRVETTEAWRPHPPYLIEVRLESG